MFNKILFPVDLEHTKTVDKALAIALEEARRSDARIYVMTVMPGFGSPLVASFFDDDSVKKALNEVGVQLKKFVEDNIPQQFRAKTIVTEGNPAEMILKQEKKYEIDLIVISSHDTEIEQMLLGSCSAKVVRHSTCSVMVVKP